MYIQKLTTGGRRQELRIYSTDTQDRRTHIHTSYSEWSGQHCISPGQDEATAAKITTTMNSAKVGRRSHYILILCMGNTFASGSSSCSPRQTVQHEVSVQPSVKWPVQGVPLHHSASNRHLSWWVTWACCGPFHTARGCVLRCRAGPCQCQTGCHCRADGI